MELTPKLAQLPQETFEIFETSEVDDIRERLTVGSLEDGGLGIVITYSVRKSRAKKVVRALGRNISLTGGFPMFPTCIYMFPGAVLGAERRS